MRMAQKMKDECLGIVLVFFASVLVAESGGGLMINVQHASKKLDEAAFVYCRDQGGLPVTWHGPKGILGPKTRPSVQMGSFGTALNFTAIVAEDAGIYTCRAGHEQKEFNLTVSIEGSLTIAQPNTTRVVNETFFTSCADAARRPISWYNPKGMLLSAKTRPSVQVASYGTRMVFNNVQTEDSGMYSCSAGNEQKKYYLTVKDPVEFLDTDVIQTGVEGENILLRCEVKGGKVSWYIDNADITDTNKFKVIGDGLYLKNVSRTDSKWYICRGFQQSTGFVLDRKIKLRVKHKPTLMQPMYAEQEVVWSYVNGTVNLTCMVAADPPAKFEWKKILDQKHKIGIIINDTVNVSILQLLVKNSTFGNYKCIAKNQYGTLEKHFSLERGVKPEAPKFIALKGSNANLLDLEIRAPDKTEKDGMDTKGFNVEYKAKENSDWQNRDFNVSEGNSYLLDQLEQDTEYEVRAATRNVAGLSEFTNISIFTTLKSEGCRVQLHLSSTYIVVNSIFLLLLTRSVAYW